MDRFIHKSWNRKDRAGIERTLASRVDEKVLGFGHMGRMEEYCMARWVLISGVSGGQVPGRPWLGGMDGVKRPWAAEG